MVPLCQVDGPHPLGDGFYSPLRCVLLPLAPPNSADAKYRPAYALKDVFEALSAAEKSGLSDEEKKKLEDKAAQMGLNALFKVRLLSPLLSPSNACPQGAKLEVESVIREVCDRLLSEDVPIPELRKRAVAIGILGSVYEDRKSVV